MFVTKERLNSNPTWASLSRTPDPPPWPPAGGTTEAQFVCAADGHSSARRTAQDQRVAHQPLPLHRRATRAHRLPGAAESPGQPLAVQRKVGRRRLSSASTPCTHSEGRLFCKMLTDISWLYSGLYLWCWIVKQSPPWTGLLLWGFSWFVHPARWTCVQDIVTVDHVGECLVGKGGGCVDLLCEILCDTPPCT